MPGIAVSGLITATSPPPQERMHSLLTVPGVNLGDPGGRWEMGVNIWGYPTAVPDLWAPCADEGTMREKESDSEQPQAGFEGFEMYVPVFCSARGNARELAERALAVLRATQAWGVEKALAHGIVGMSNKHLVDSDLTSLATGVSARVGISYLEKAIAATGRQGLIHITPSVADAADGALMEPSQASDPVYTQAGTPVAIGAGYVGADPSIDQPALSAPGATTDWIFATGPVEVRIEDDPRQLPEDIAEALDRTNNDLVYRAEKTAVVGWDTALQVGVLVNWAS
ncbi:MAG: hypothetical protein K0S82_49 [Gaiellaceae bacterium]|jgi:hypothetical protein|nr:hypothetical protein [Gaiellaceae bacterium]